MPTPAVPFVRTPETNFAGLADFPFAPHYFDLDGLRMHYLDEGPSDGPVALLVHGMPTWSYLYRTIIPPLVAAGYRCIAPDHIGFGRSDKVTDPAWYDIARHTANLRRLIDALDLRDITLFVQDWGGPTGLAQVADQPERFSRLVIMNTWLHHEGYRYTEGIQNWIQQNSPGGLFAENVPGRFNWGTLMVIGTRRATPQESLGVVMSGGTPAYGPEADAVRRAYDAPFEGLGDAGVTGPRQFPLSIPFEGDDASAEERSEGRSSSGVRRRGNADAQARHFDVINATSLPVHFIWGLADNVFDGDWGRAWQARIPHSTWDAFDDAAHFLQDTHGDRIAQLVLGYAGRARP